MTNIARGAAPTDSMHWLTPLPLTHTAVHAHPTSTPSTFVVLKSNPGTEDTHGAESCYRDAAYTRPTLLPRVYAQQGHHMTTYKEHRSLKRPLSCQAWRSHTHHSASSVPYDDSTNTSSAPPMTSRTPTLDPSSALPAYP